nr:sulfite exporter TauE/SafE family protein [candidate division Zixibacteria bacterium]
MDWYIYPLVVLAGFVCGFINTLAGSGSLVTLPLLIFLGLPANVANGTNRVAILLQTMVAVEKFRREKRLDPRRGGLLAIPAIFGAVVGAQIAVNLDEQLMRQTIGVLMVVMLVVILVKPKRWLVGRPEITDRRPGLILILTFFGIGVYGGFIQAGVGIFLLAGLVLAAGYDLVKANAIKNLIILCFTVFALLVFIFNNQVRWEIGLILAVGNMLGAWVAARLAVEKGAGFVRWLLIGVIIVSAVMLLGVDKLIAGLFR